jgi:uroporphyrinogen decarboxylase
MTGSKPIREPDFRILCDTLFCRQSSRLPLIELGIDKQIKSVILGRPCQTLSDEIEFMYRTGYDFIKVQPGISFFLQNASGSAPGAYKTGSKGDKNGRQWARAESGVIQNWQDFDQYPWPDKSSIDYSRLESVKNIIPDGMGVIGQYGDIFTLAWELMGFDNFAVAIFEQPDLIQAIIEKLSGLILSMFESMAEMEWVGILWYSDDIATGSGPLISPALLDTFFFPHLQYIGSLCQKRQIPFIYHSDGRLWTVLDRILSSGVNGLHPIEPASMKITEIGEKYGDRLCLCGGIDVDLLSRGSPDQVRRHTLSLKESLCGNVSWCAGSSNSITDYVSPDNYLSMLQALLQG